MQNVIIRNAVKSDIPHMCDMLEELFSIESDFKIDGEKQTAGLTLLMNKSDAIVLVADTGNVSGMVTGQMVISTEAGGHSLLIEDLFVMPGLRKQGVASMLISQLISWAKDQGATRAQLVAEASNSPAINFYSKLGFAQSTMTGIYKMI